MSRVGLAGWDECDAAHQTYSTLHLPEFVMHFLRADGFALVHFQETELNRLDVLLFFLC